MKPNITYKHCVIVYPDRIYTDDEERLQKNLEFIGMSFEEFLSYFKKQTVEYKIKTYHVRFYEDKTMKINHYYTRCINYMNKHDFYEMCDDEISILAFEGINGTKHIFSKFSHYGKAKNYSIVNEENYNSIVEFFKNVFSADIYHPKIHQSIYGGFEIDIPPEYMYDRVNNIILPVHRGLKIALEEFEKHKKPYTIEKYYSPILWLLRDFMTIPYPFPDFDFVDKSINISLVKEFIESGVECIFTVNNCGFISDTDIIIDYGENVNVNFMKKCIIYDKSEGDLIYDGKVYSCFDGFNPKTHCEIDKKSMKMMVQWGKDNNCLIEL